MKRRSIALLLILSLVVGIFSTVLMYDKREPMNEVSASSVVTGTTLDDKLVSAGLSAITSGSVGTNANPYDIVEIVPYKGMAQLGYLIGGQEPIDISSLIVTSSELNKFAVSTTGESILEFKDDLKTKSELIEGVDNPDEWERKETEKSGFFTYVGVGKGQYKQIIGIENVTRVPIYVGDLYDQTQTEESEAVKEETPDEFTLVDGNRYDLQSSVYTVKDMSAIKSGSGYAVKEENVSKSEYIFKYNPVEDSQALGLLTYNALVFDNLKDYYDARNVQIQELINAGGTSEYVCYPTYKLVDGKLEFTYGSDGEKYVLFVPSMNGTGEYIVDKVRPETEGKSHINISLCYYEMALSEYSKVMATSQQYVNDESYIKDVLTDGSGAVTNITYGNSSTLFIKDTEATGVTRYKAVTSDAINEYYSNIKAALPADSDYICEPMYFKHLNYYIYIDSNDFSEEELAELDLQYVVFVPDENGQYVVSSATADVEGDESKLNLAIAYQSELGFSKATSNGQYKIIVNDAQYILADDGTGDYAWQDATVPDDAVVDHLSTEKIWIKNRVFYYWAQSGYANNEVFKKKFLGLSADKVSDFVCKVHVVTPEELYADKSVLDSADLIYMSDNLNDTYLKERVYLWETMGRNKEGSNNYVKKAADGTLSYNNEAEAKKGMNFMANDLDWDTAKKIYYMTAGVDNVYVPIIMDSHIYTETKNGTSGNYSAYVGNGKMIKEIEPAYNTDNGIKFINKTYSNKSNAFKLYILLTVFDDPIVGYNKFFNKFEFTGDTNNKVDRGASYKNSIVTTGSGRNKIGKFQYKASVGTDDKSVYWSEYTFLHEATSRDNAGAQKEGYSKSWAYYVNNNKQEALNMVNYNVLTVDGSDGLMVSDLMSNQFKNFLVSNPSAADKPYKVDIEMDTYINDKFGGDFSRTNVMNYLLNYDYYSELNAKDVIRILEIEPCKDFASKKDMIQQFRQYLPYYQGKIEIEQWISTEYIGKIDDLNTTFDIVYFGIRSGTKGKVGSLRTIREQTTLKDTNMRGLYYFHMGDRVSSFSSTLTYKIVVNGVTKYSLGDKIDNTVNLRWNGNDISNLNYTDLSNYVKANYAVVLEDVIYDCDNTVIDDSSNLYKFAKNNKNKPNVFSLSSIAGESQNQLIEFNKYAGWSKLQFELSSKSLQPSTEVIKRDRNDRKILFEYKINDFRATESDTYTVSLYADNNADGSYSEAELLVQNTGEKASKFKKGYYTISRDLMDDYCGCVHWALIVQKDENKEERNLIEGYLEIRTAQDKGKEKIRILQITSASGSTWNLSKDLANKSTEFGKHASSLADYELEIKTITTSDFNGWYSSKPYNKNTGAGEQLLENYDMIIYGFGDSVSDISNANGAWDNLTLFMDSGKSMLFTHDTTSMYNNGDNASNSTIYLRDRVGMNRFRIPTKAMLTGNFTYPNTYYDKATYPSNKHQSGAIDKTTKTYMAIHGYTDWHMSRYCDNSTGFSVNTKYVFESQYSSTDTKKSMATKVNEGQITNYPFDLSDTIRIALTHAQYYALDMEDEDLVVWYCLGSGNTSSCYNACYNDTRNNYYIYSIRNVMYSGVGHSPVGGEPDEVQLFINTMIAAYNCAIKPPEMIVENEDSRLKTATQDESILYYYSEYGSNEENAGIGTGDTYDVYVNPQDYNLISEIIRVRIKDMNGNDVTNSILFKELDSDGKPGVSPKIIDGYVQLKSGHHYVFQFPLSKLNNNDGVYTYTFEMLNAEDVPATKEITMGARTLFDVY